MATVPLSISEYALWGITEQSVRRLNSVFG